MSNFLDYREHIGVNPEKFFKSTLAESPRLLLGLNCLEPGQEQAIHNHAEQDKFYYVIEGDGDFTVADETRTAGPGVTIWAPAGAPHGVVNHGSARLVLLVGIAPWK